MVSTRQSTRSGPGTPARQRRKGVNGETMSPSTSPGSGEDVDGNSSDEKKKDSALRQFVETDGHFSLVRNFHLADFFTLMNGACGTLSILTSCRYLLAEASVSTSLQSIMPGQSGTTVDLSLLYVALGLPLAGLFFDFMDGKVARWRKASSMLGQELDSLADLLSFGVAPAVLAFAIGLRHPLDTLCLTMFVCAGIARLARFNATVALIPTDSKGKAKYFEGLPIPSSLILVGVMAVLVRSGQIGIRGDPGHWFDLRGYKAGSSILSFGPIASLIDQATVSISGGMKGLPLGVIHVPSFLGGQVHAFALVWLIWASLMVSKTLKVPKL